jgi:hypothetical protein
MKCPRDKFLWWEVGQPHHQKPKLLRVSHRTVTQTDDQINFPLGPRTICHWKCEQCGNLYTTEKYGQWDFEDLA